jgi:hypothetical protein
MWQKQFFKEEQEKLRELDHQKRRVSSGYMPERKKQKQISPFSRMPPLRQGLGTNF